MNIYIGTNRSILLFCNPTTIKDLYVLRVRYTSDLVTKKLDSHIFQFSCFYIFQIFSILYITATPTYACYRFAHQLIRPPQPTIVNLGKTNRHFKIAQFNVPVLVSTLLFLVTTISLPLIIVQG